MVFCITMAATVVWVYIKFSELSISFHFSSAKKGGLEVVKNIQHIQYSPFKHPATTGLLDGEIYDSHLQWRRWSWEEFPRQQVGDSTWWVWPAHNLTRYPHTYNPLHFYEMGVVQLTTECCLLAHTPSIWKPECLKQWREALNSPPQAKRKPMASRRKNCLSHWGELVSVQLTGSFVGEDADIHHILQPLLWPVYSMHGENIMNSHVSHTCPMRSSYLSLLILTGLRVSLGTNGCLLVVSHCFLCMVALSLLLLYLPSLTCSRYSWRPKHTHWTHSRSDTTRAQKRITWSSTWFITWCGVKIFASSQF